MKIAHRHGAAAAVVSAVMVVLAAVAVAVAVSGPADTQEPAAVREPAVRAAAPNERQDATQAVTLAFEQWLDGSQPDASLAVIEDAAQLRPALEEAVKRIPGLTSYR